MSSSDALIAKAQSIIDNNGVVIFSKSYCPYCKKAKEVLNSYNAKYFAYELDLEKDGTELQAALEVMTKQRTVPNIFINKRHIGGSSDLVAIENKLPQLLKEANAI